LLFGLDSPTRSFDDGAVAVRREQLMRIFLDFDLDHRSSSGSRRVRRRQR
jgi:hypothetical protein